MLNVHDPGTAQSCTEGFAPEAPGVIEAYGLTPGGSRTPGGGGHARLAPAAPAVGGGGGICAAAAPVPAAAASGVARALPRRAHMTRSRVFLTVRLPWSALHAFSASLLRWKVMYAQSLLGSTTRSRSSPRGSRKGAGSRQGWGWAQGEGCRVIGRRGHIAAPPGLSTRATSLHTW